MVRIALDAMGGDRGSAELVLGAVMALQAIDVSIKLLGDTEKLQKILAEQHVSLPVEIIHTSQVIEMHESPFEALRKKKDSSIAVAFEMLRKGQVDAVVSAGNSGATMAAAIRYLGRLKNISRPGIAGVFPTLKGQVVMMDVGANVDCRPDHLLQFGIMATAFSKVVYHIDKPRIGLLSIGEEGGKGNVLVKKSHELFKSSSLNFIGNVEGRDIFGGDVDVIVCDGFVGNVCLKVSEGLAEATLSLLKSEIERSPLGRLGYFLARKAFSNFKKKVDYAEYGGAPLLGLNGTGIICHGRSNAKAIKNAIQVAADLVESNVNEHIEKMLEKVTAEVEHEIAAVQTKAVEN